MATRTNCFTTKVASHRSEVGFRDSIRGAARTYNRAVRRAARLALREAR